MVSIKAYRIPLVPATASGTTALSDPITAGGILEALSLVRPSTNQITTGAKITITDQLTGFQYFAATATSTGNQQWLPRFAVVDTSGAGVGYTSAAAPATPNQVTDKMPIPGNSRLKAVVASGGANTSGVLWAFISGA